MKKLLLVLTLFIGFASQSIASHGVGGDTRFIQTGPTQYTVVFTFFRYCTGITAPASLTNAKILDNVTNATITTFTPIKDSSVNIVVGDSCYIPPGLCIEAHYYSGTVTIPPNPNGVYVTWTTCCRNGPLVNVVSSGNVWYAMGPSSAIPSGNSSPRFVEYPSDGYLCIGNNKLIDFSCTDPDGDSLRYSLINPFDGTAGGGTRPFTLTAWNAGFSLTNILGAGSLCVINPATGIVTARPTQLGLYVVSVKCEEFRGGVKIGEVVRDAQISSLNCLFSSTDSVSVSSCDNYYFKNTFLSSTGVYRDTFSTTCKDSIVVLNLTILPNPIINSSPSNALVAVGNNATFPVYASSSLGALAFQWQEDDGSGVFNNLSNFFPYSGVNTAVLTITGAQLFMHQNKYRCIVYKSLCADTSGYGILDVSLTSQNEESRISDKIVLHPNPTNSILNIESNFEYSSGKIINSIGKIVLEFDNAKKIDVSNFSKGTYSLVFLVENKEIWINKKLVIQ
ncbi:T9SS type A sorting domain-containing protein [Flavobacteriales bacterium]|nr:T9SS type A sorting domain-containing protein [Flavobacteriales bacterium]